MLRSAHPSTKYCTLLEANKIDRVCQDQSTLSYYDVLGHNGLRTPRQLTRGFTAHGGSPLVSSIVDDVEEPTEVEMIDRMSPAMSYKNLMRKVP